MEVPQSIRRLVGELSQLPAIGPRQALRLAFHLVHRGRASSQALAEALTGLSALKICSRCFLTHENTNDLCPICENPGRRQDLVMILEKETDLISIENTGKFKGRYLVLGEMPRAGQLTEKQIKRIEVLKENISTLPQGIAEEIILGFNPSSLGDFHSSLVQTTLSSSTKKISKLGRGLPSGGEIEFADDETLGSALQNRN